MITPKRFFLDAKDIFVKKSEKKLSDKGILSFFEKFFENLKTEIESENTFFSIQEFILYENRKEGTLFHLACKHDNDRLFNWLLTTLGSDLPLDLVLDLQNQFGNTTKKVKQSVLALKKPKDRVERGVVGLVGVMGALSSPHKRKVAILQDGQNVSSADSSLSQVAINPQTKDASTPGGSRLFPIWNIQVLKASSLEPSEIKIFTEPSSAPISRDVPQLDLLIDIMPEPPATLPENTKRPLKFMIDRDIIALWEKEDNRESRYRGQKETMGGYSACDIARLLKFKDVEDRSFHWCHIAAYSMGGPDGTKPISKDDYDSVGPQQPCNLVFGTKEANAHMLIIEHIAKTLIKKGIVEQLRIQVETSLYPGYEPFHIANFLKYTMLDPKSFGIHLELDMLTRRTMREAEITQMIEAILNLFIQENANRSSGLRTPLTMPTCKNPGIDLLVDDGASQPLSFSKGHKHPIDPVIRKLTFKKIKVA